MTNPSVERQGAGFRHVVVMKLNAAGYPDATSTSAYEGLQLTGAKALTLTDPEPRDVTHFGDDRVLQRDILPPTEPLSGEIRGGIVNDTLDATLSDDLAFTLGEVELYGMGTDNRGEEDQVSILAYRQSLNADLDSANLGERSWMSMLFPRAYLVVRESGFEDTPEERAYSMRPLFTKKHVWGTSFANATEGFLQAQGVRMVSQYKPKVVAFRSDGTQVTYVLPTAFPAQAVAKVTIWDAGVQQTEEFTMRTTDVVFSNSPTSSNIVVMLYEYE